MSTSRQLAERWSIARHEAAHVVVAAALGVSAAAWLSSTGDGRAAYPAGSLRGRCLAIVAAVGEFAEGLDLAVPDLTEQTRETPEQIEVEGRMLACRTVPSEGSDAARDLPTDADVIADHCTAVADGDLRAAVVEALIVAGWARSLIAELADAIEIAARELFLHGVVHRTAHNHNPTFPGV